MRPPAKGRSVLLVEQDEVERARIALAFRSSGWYVCEAANAEEGLACLDGGIEYSVLVVDLADAELSGYDMLYLLRHFIDGARPPVVALDQGETYTASDLQSLGVRSLIHRVVPNGIVMEAERAYPHR